MSFICGGKENWIKDIYWLIQYKLKENKHSCPRCGHHAFVHGFYPKRKEYCTKCHLWEPDWGQKENDVEEAMAQYEKIN